MQKREKLYWTPCAAHCIDLIFEDFEKNLNVHELTIKTRRKITNYIYGRTMLISLLKKFTKGREGTAWSYKEKEPFASEKDE